MLFYQFYLYGGANICSDPTLKPVSMIFHIQNIYLNFCGCKIRIMHEFFIKIAEKYFFNFWMQPIMISCQKYALSLGFLSPIMLDRSEPCRGRFSIFEKKVQFFHLKSKKLTPSHFVQKLAQIVGYGQTVIGIVQRGPRRCFSIPIIIPESVQMKKSKSMKKIFLNFFSYQFPQWSL